MKTLLKEIVMAIKVAAPSVLVWNIVTILGIILFGFLLPQYLIFPLLIGSIIAFVLALDFALENQFWILIMPITWILFIILGIIWGAVGFYHKVIRPLNQWLDRNKLKQNS